MDSHAQSNGQVFVTPTPIIVNQGELNGTCADTYPPTYQMVVQQQKAASASGKCKSIFAGRISTIWLGSVLLVFGAMSQAGSAVAIRYFARLSEVGAGIWCGYMFQAAGAVAIAAGHHGTRNLIIGAIVTSALAIVASITLLTIAGTGIQDDMYNYWHNCYEWCDSNDSYQSWCPCYSENWEKSAITANAIIAGAAALAFIGGLWVLVVACIAIRRNPASFQGVSVPAQAIANAAQPNLYENIPHQRECSVPVQHVQQPQQQLIYLSQLPSNAAYQPTFSQVFQVPAQMILNTSQSNVPEEMRNQQQIHSMPVQYVQQQQQYQQQQYQQQMPLIQLQPTTIAPSTFPLHGQENQAFARADDDNAKQL